MTAQPDRENGRRRDGGVRKRHRHPGRWLIARSSRAFIDIELAVGYSPPAAGQGADGSSLDGFAAETQIVVRAASGN